MLETIISYVNSISAELLVSIITNILMTLGIFTALFKKEIIDYIYRPKLKVSIPDKL